MKGQLVLGITGGSGSGKSQVCKLLASMGAHIIDADEIGHEVTARSDVLREIEVAFGPEGAFDAFKELFPHISCTHVHDNYYNKDLHLLPYQGNLEWTAHMRYMKENGYRGNFTYEFVYGNMPPMILHEYLLFAKKIADHLFSL